MTDTAPLACNETAVTPFRVAFWTWDRKGDEARYTGTVVSQFCDPEDYRDSYQIRLDADCAWFEGQHMDAYIDEVRPLEEA